jgi:2-amino-4-hydroxy-6-hydroxymethyldihydropteridine diphosphokinase
MTWQPAYVGVGSNLGDPVRQVHDALARLAGLPESRLIASSALYRTPPFGPVVQPPFVNAVAGLLTTLTPRAMFEALQALETTLGRQPPRERWGPRHMDLDLLVHGALRIDEPGLRVPHAGIADRAFVLVPLAEIARELEVPGVGSVSELLRRVDVAGIERLP